MRITLACSVGFVVACSTSPQNACFNLVSTYCDKATTCVEAPGANHTADVNTCEEAAYKSLTCSTAKGTSPNLSQCQGDVNALDCDAVKEGVAQGTNALPASCNGVILF